MESNKTYLQRIHLAALIAIGAYFFISFVIRNDNRIIPFRCITDTIALSSIVFAFAALGAVTGNWKEAGIGALFCRVRVYVVEEPRKPITR